MTDQHELEALERLGWEALCGPDGAGFYRDLMADDGLMVFPGLVLEKERTIEAIEGEPPWEWFEMSDVHTVEAAPDVAFVTYRATAERAGEGTYRAMMSTVYARRDGRWRLVLHQQSPFRSTE